MSLEKIASTAESLGIRFHISPSVKNGNDVIEFQILSNSAIGAEGIHPLFSLKWTESNSMPSFCWKFVPKGIFPSWKRSKHFISVQLPHVFGSYSDSFASFFGMFISGCVFVSNAFSFSRLRNKLFRCVRVMSIPPRSSFTDKVLPFTFKRACFTAILACYLGGATSERLFADSALEGHSSSSYGIRENWVNSGKHLESYYSVVSKSILSQPLAEMPLKVQRLGIEPDVRQYDSHENPARKG